MRIQVRMLRFFDWCMLRLSRVSTTCGVRVWLVRPAAANPMILDRISAALALIERSDSRTFARIKRDLQGIWVYWSVSRAYYHHAWRLCVIDEDAVGAPDTSVAAVASWIVHEAMHARLWRAGFRYASADRERIERVCVRAELNFALRLDDGEPQITEAIAMLQRESNVWSGEASHDAIVRRLELLNAPKWLKKWAAKRARTAA